VAAVVVVVVVVVEGGMPNRVYGRRFALDLDETQNNAIVRGIGNTMWDIFLFALK
jgi:hypothetical protein